MTCMFGLIEGETMRQINVREARRRIGRLLDAVLAGEEIIITRRGKPVARLLKAKGREGEVSRFPSRRELRLQLPSSRRCSKDLLREMREER